MKFYEYAFGPTDLSINSKEIGKQIGYPEKGMPKDIKEKTDSILPDLIGLVDVKGGFAVSDNISFKPASLRIENADFQTKKIITSSLIKASSIAIFVCTIGEDVSNLASKLIKEDALQGYIVDVAASVMAEKAADKIQEKIRQFAKVQDKSVSNRYSPGYCGWPVSDQHLLFSLLPDNFCGISLNEAALMYPVKSVSGIIGIGKEIVKNPYHCSICDQKDCMMTPSTQ